jgi:hypothetical protein
MNIVVVIYKGVVEDILCDEPTDTKVYVHDVETSPDYGHSFVCTPTHDPITVNRLMQMEEE